MKINVGCASRPKPGYLNVDLDSYETIRSRYPNLELLSDMDFLQGNILDLDLPDGCATEILCDSMLEHLTFKQEPVFFRECHRLLQPSAFLKFSVPDFEAIVELWLRAEDDWRDFFRNDDDAIKMNHWFGQYEYSFKSRWGYLTASIFGPQNGEGQYHHNCYTEGKIRSMLPKAGFELVSIDRFRWKGDRDPMISVVARKNLV